MLTCNEPYIIIVSGPNGVGKTTFYNQIISQNPFLSDATFLNYDNEIAAVKSMPEIAVQYADIAQSSPLSHQNMCHLRYLQSTVSKLASHNMRSKMTNAFSNSDNIIFETTTSGRHIKNMAKKYNYKIYGFHICVQCPELSVARVQHRVRNGGHDIPTETIYRRYAENINMLPQILASESSAIVIDNSSPKPFTPVFALSDGYMIDINPCPAYLSHIRDYMNDLCPQTSFREILHLTHDIDINKLPPEQREAFVQVIILNLFGKIQPPKSHQLTR